MGEGLKLYAALGIRSGDVVAFAGAGGKSTAIRNLAAELSAEGLKVIVAPTTKMGLAEVDGLGPLIVSEDDATLAAGARKALSSSGVVLLGRERISKERLGGLAPESFAGLAGLADVVLVEADGARHRSIKGTADHEPLLPEAVTLVVAVADIDALGKPVSEKYVHRPEVFADITGVNLDGRITAPAFARALSKGSLVRVPKTARAAALITGVEPGRTMSDAAVVARELWRSGIPTVVFALLSREHPAQVWNP